MSEHRFQVTRTHPSVDGQGAVHITSRGINVPADMTVGELVRTTLYAQRLAGEEREPWADTDAYLTIRATVDTADPRLRGR